MRLTSREVAILERYDWPGNVRELQHVIERATILAQGGRLRLDLALPRRPSGSEFARQRQAPIVESRPSAAVVPEAEVRRRERENVLAALEREERGPLPGTAFAELGTVGTAREREPAGWLDL
jgi:DNA-binding NtrC family response regulator